MPNIYTIEATASTYNTTAIEFSQIYNTVLNLQPCYNWIILNALYGFSSEMC